MMHWLRRFLETANPETKQERMARAELDAARQRWIKHNAEAKAAGCKCGKPATHVRRYGGTIGGVPSEVWTCEKHKNVGQWSKIGNGAWIPDGELPPQTEEWRVG